jgi:hypothetical protein
MQNGTYFNKFLDEQLLTLDAERYLFQQVPRPDGHPRPGNPVRFGRHKLNFGEQ